MLSLSVVHLSPKNRKFVNEKKTKSKWKPNWEDDEFLLVFLAFQRNSVSEIEFSVQVGTSRQREGDQREVGH